LEVDFGEDEGVLDESGVFGGGDEFFGVEEHFVGVAEDGGVLENFHITALHNLIAILFCPDGP